MGVDRRSLIAVSLGAGLGVGLAATAVAAGPRSGTDRGTGTGKSIGTTTTRGAGTLATDLVANSNRDQTTALQSLIDRSGERGETLVLPQGTYRTGPLVLRPGSRIRGAGAGTALQLTGGGALISAIDADNIMLEDLRLDGAHVMMGTGASAGLVTLKSCRNICLDHLDVQNSTGHGILLEGSAGRIEACRIAHVLQSAIHSIDAAGVAIASNDIADCGNNGIQVWRSAVGEDGSQIYGNRIARILALGGGSGENGNGINVYRAGSVAIANNRITDCAYSAIRGNAASDIQIVANSCQRLGEVAIYAEFGFEGALIASNIVDGAATGISVTNFDVGGRLAVIQGNLIRNLFRREHEVVDKRGEGIAVEADASITGNTIEGAPTCGIMIGWGRHMRDCVATGNLVRNARIGIMLTSDPGSGACLISNNMISGTTDGAIRAMVLGKPHGPDLAFTGTRTARVAISGNVAG